MADPQAAAALTHQIQRVLIPLVRAVVFLNDRTSPLFWVYVPSTLLFGLIGWWRFEKQPGENLRHFLGRHFSSKLWWHRSARVDYRFYVVNAVVFALLIGPFLLWGAWAADGLRSVMKSAFGNGPVWSATALGGWPVKLAFTLAFFVAYDFGRWLGHTLLHDVPPLWEFHKVHHSAEVLTPFTAFRVHPVDLAVTTSVTLLTTAPVTALFLYLFPQAITAYTFFGANLVIGVSGLIANLKHWQVWFTYGPLDGWWISPAHHQIHHSADPKHWGKNRGFEIGLWDRWYGSLWIPAREREVHAMGLGDGTDDGRWHSVWRLYAWPFAGAARWLRDALRRPPRAAATSVLVALLLLPTPRADAAPASSMSTSSADSVWLEDLTWPELSQRIKAGDTTVLVPIGGTEQNGPAMAFGKHNALVHYAAEQIARRAGHTLVAPVLPLAPEGDFIKHDGNLAWPGTLNLRQSTLSAVLEDEVSSLALAGFTVIALLGDHGGSQAAQAAVAKQLTFALAGQGIRVISLDRYYEPASLADRVAPFKLPPDAIGDHAGLVDTAELMSVKPEWVRMDRLDPARWSGLPLPAGASGNPRLATADSGHALIGQRIAAGTSQLLETLSR
jgi:creatinine amidohydrolase/Fe(II)-dependent formamide hydrolase-like protein/sterol desaturase/sphingolipid hydroxylase (fatty acid hydroxylase superfamily)